jgi:hypothetical protein
MSYVHGPINQLKQPFLNLEELKQNPFKISKIKKHIIIVGTKTIFKLLLLFLLLLIIIIIKFTILLKIARVYL